MNTAILVLIRFIIDQWFHHDSGLNGNTFDFTSFSFFKTIVTMQTIFNTIHLQAIQRRLG